MQADLSYIQDGQRYAAKLWTEQPEAAEHALALSTQTAHLHNAKPIGSLGWLCVQAKPTLWVDALNSVLITPRQLLQYLQLQQATLDCKSYLELDYAKEINKVKHSWARINPKRLSAPKADDYAEAALVTVFLLDTPDISFTVEEGIQLLYEQGFETRPTSQKVESISQSLSHWWHKG